MRGGNISNKHTRHILTWLLLLAVAVLAVPMPAYAGFLEETIFDFVSMVGGGLVYISGNTLDWAFIELVEGMGTNFIDNGIGTVVNEMWVVVRDLFNILFIFGLIYIGFRTILFSDDTQTKKALGWLIIAALLINFSLFITKGIVDVSNIMADRLHEALTISTGGSISEAFKGLIGLDSFYSDTYPFDEIDANTGIRWMYIVGILLLSLVIAITFFAGAFMLFARFIAIVFLLIFSPVMFIGMIFPKFDNYTKMYWDRLLNYAFFAPAFIFALLMSARVLQILAQRVEGGRENLDYTQALASKDGNVDVIAYLLIAMAFMIGSIVMAQKMGIAGAGTTMSVFGKLRGGAQNQLKRAAGGAARGTASFAGRNTIGSMSRNRRKKFDNYIARGGTGAAALKKTGFDRTIRSGLEAGENAKFGGGYSYADVNKYEKERDKRSGQIRQTDRVKEALASRDETRIREALRDATNTQLVEIAKSNDGKDLILQNAGMLEKNQVNALRTNDELGDEFQRDVNERYRSQVQATTITNLGGDVNNINVEIRDLRQAGKDQLESIGHERLSQEQNAINLTPDQMKHIDALRDEGKLTPEQAQRIRNTRQSGLTRIAEGYGVQGSTMNIDDLLALRPKEMAELPAETVEELGELLPVATLRAMADNSTQTRDVQRRIRERITNYANNLPEDTPDNELQRIADVDAWLRNSPQASSFGR